MQPCLIGRPAAADDRNDSDRLGRLVQQQFETAERRPPSKEDGAPQPKSRPLKGRNPDSPQRVPSGQEEEGQPAGSLLHWLSAFGSVQIR